MPRVAGHRDSARTLISEFESGQQSLSAAQSAGNTLVLGVPGGFVPLKNGKSKETSGEQGEG